MTPSATNSTAAEVLVNHLSAKTLNTGRMTPSATNITAAEALINHVSAETLNTGLGYHSPSIQCFSTGMVY
jgi:methylglyoxal synthase